MAANGDAVAADGDAIYEIIIMIIIINNIIIIILTLIYSYTKANK